jgi:thioredoxin reductase
MDSPIFSFGEILPDFQRDANFSAKRPHSVCGMVRPMVYDALIVGGGPTGLSAALILGRCRRRVLLIDSAQQRNATSRGVSGFLSRDGIDPCELVEISRRQIEAYPSVEFLRGEAVSACRVDDGFTVKTSEGATFKTRRLLLATGLVDVLPPVEGLSRFWGKSVFVCPLCDGWEARDQPLLVYGSGPLLSAFAVEVRIWSEDLVMATPDASALPPRDRELLERMGIPILESRLIRLEGKGDQVEKAVFEDGTVLSRKGVFLFTEQIQRSELAGSLGCEFTEDNVVNDREMERTNVPGLYVAGNASKGLQLAIVAAAEGAKAAFSINESLVAEDTGFWIPEDLAV